MCKQMSVRKATCVNLAKLSPPTLTCRRSSSVDVGVWDAPYGVSGRSRTGIAPGGVSGGRIRLTIDIVFGFGHVLWFPRLCNCP